MSDEEVEKEKTVRDRMAELVDEGVVLDLPAEAVVDPAPLGYIEVRAWKWRTVMLRRAASASRAWKSADWAGSMLSQSSRG